MVATMAIADGGDDALGRAIAALRRRGEKVEELDNQRLDRALAIALADEDAREDEREPLLIGTLQWQRRERHRAHRDGRDYTVAAAIKHAFTRIEETKRALKQMHSDEQDALGLQWHPTVVSIADMEAALTFVPNDRGHNKARWVYAIVVGREPVVHVVGMRRIEEYKEAEPRSIYQAARWLDLPRSAAEAGYKYAEAVIVEFLCHEGQIE